VRTADVGWDSAQTLGGGAVAAVLLAAFVVRQAMARTPLLPLHIFRHRQITGANVVAVLVFAAGFGFQFVTALYLQRVLGYNPLQTGLAFLPTPIMIGTVSLFLSARMTNRFGARVVLIAGLATFLVTLILLSRAPVQASYFPHIMPILTLMGAGMGFAIPAIMSLAMSGVSAEDAGLASGLINTTQQAGAAIGLAVLATLAAARTDASLAHGTAGVTALWDGYSLAYLVTAAFVVVGIVVAFTALRPASR
jgi:MFS family permease